MSNGHPSRMTDGWRFDSSQPFLIGFCLQLFFVKKIKKSLSYKRIRSNVVGMTKTGGILGVFFEKKEGLS